MRRAWDPQQPVESLFKQIQDCADYSEAGGVIVGHPHQINVGHAKKFFTGYFMSACRRWNEKPNVEKTWAQFKTHFAAAHRQHKQIQGLQPHQVITQQTPLWAKLKNKWLKKPLKHWPTWPQPLQRTEGQWQHSLKQMRVWPSSWKITPMSYGNLRLFCKRKKLKEEGNAVLTLIQKNTVGHTGTRSRILTPV
jgi:hypothetical protein